MGRSDKKAKQVVEVKEAKTVVPFFKENSYFGMSPRFIFRKYDANMPWSIPYNNKPSTDSLFKNLYKNIAESPLLQWWDG